MIERQFFRKILTTSNFFFVLAEKLDEIFSGGWLYDDTSTYCESTLGWGKALKETFEECNLIDCLDYYEKLDWDVSDITDGRIGSLLCAIVLDDDGNRIRMKDEV